MSDIPEARRILERVLDAGGIPIHARTNIEQALDLMKREPPVRKTEVKSVPMTPALAAQIRSYAAIHPTASNQQIGERFSVNTGRVSEALNGLR